MYWRASVSGQIELPPGGLERWLQTPIDYAALGGWPREGHFAPGGAASASVTEALAHLERIPGKPLSVEAKGTSLRFAGELDKDQLADCDLDLGAVIRLTAAVDGRGEVLILDELGDFGYRFTVGDRTSRFERLRPAAIKALFAGGTSTSGSSAPAVEAPRGAASPRPVKGPRPAARGPRTWGPSTFSAADTRVHAALRAALTRAEDTALAGAARAAGEELLVQLTAGGLAPLAVAIPGGADIRTALSEGSPLVDLSHEGARDRWFFGVGLGLLARVDPASAEGIAADALTDAPARSTLRAEALRVLGKSTGDAAMAALFALLTRNDGQNPDAGTAAQALAASPSPRASERVMEHLPAALALPDPVRIQLARYLIEILGAQRCVAAVAPLLDLWRWEKDKDIRAFAGAALIAIATPEALGGLTSVKERIDSSPAESSLFIKALLLLDPRGAVDRLAPRFTDQALASKRGEALARRVFSVLASDAAPPTGETSHGWLRSNERWVELGIALLPRDTDGTDVLRALSLSGDPRAVPAVLALLGNVYAPYLYEALQRLGRPEAIPALEKRLKRVKKKDESRALTELIEALRAAGPA